MAEFLVRAKWKKAIGPNNMPTDLFKCAMEASPNALSAMFRALWALQILPQIWRKAFVVPLEKPGADLSDPTNWRGIAL
jgi:hypothetical protein